MKSLNVRILSRALACFLGGMVEGFAQETLFVWPDLAPRETSYETGVLQPYRPDEDPPVDRYVNVRRPLLEIYLAPEASRNGTGILAVPGGGFGKVVTNKEGSEAAPWLAGMGISTFVLRYRTGEAVAEGEKMWERPLQDVQRALRVIRANAASWGIDRDRLGVMAFSAGGQLGARAHALEEDATYEWVDGIDAHSCAPDFSLLLYPWRVTDERTGQLLPEIRYNEQSKPTFLVHTSDDSVTSFGSLRIYMELKSHGVPVELHVYENGGHGYGMRVIEGSNIGTWPDRAADWLGLRGLAD